jgi:predicted site-specific integrase-resolvase
MKHTLEIQGRVYDSTRVFTETYGLSALTLWRWYKRALIPPPIRLGNRNYYERQQIEERLTTGEPFSSALEIASK